MICGDFNIDRLSDGKNDCKSDKKEEFSGINPAHALSNKELLKQLSSALRYRKFQDLLPEFHQGEHPVTFTANIDADTGRFVGSNYHNLLSQTAFRERNLQKKGECLDGIYFCPASDEKTGISCVDSCEVLTFPLSNPFGRVSDHSGIAAELRL